MALLVLLILPDTAQLFEPGKCWRLVSVVFVSVITGFIVRARLPEAEGHGNNDSESASE